MILIYFSWLALSPSPSMVTGTASFDDEASCRSAGSHLASISAGPDMLPKIRATPDGWTRVEFEMEKRSDSFLIIWRCEPKRIK